MNKLDFNDVSNKQLDVRKITFTRKFNRPIDILSNRSQLRTPKFRGEVQSFDICTF